MSIDATFSFSVRVESRVIRMRGAFYVSMANVFARARKDRFNHFVSDAFTYVSSSCVCACFFTLLPHHSYHICSGWAYTTIIYVFWFRFHIFCFFFAPHSFLLVSHKCVEKEYAFFDSFDSCTAALLSVVRQMERERWCFGDLLWILCCLSAVVGLLDGSSFSYTNISAHFFFVFVFAMSLWVFFPHVSPRKVSLPHFICLFFNGQRYF